MIKNCRNKSAYELLYFFNELGTDYLQEGDYCFHLRIPLYMISWLSGKYMENTSTSTQHFLLHFVKFIQLWILKSFVLVNVYVRLHGQTGPISRPYLRTLFHFVSTQDKLIQNTQPLLGIDDYLCNHLRNIKYY